MVKDLSYGTISSVLESWEALKRTTPDYEKVAGVKLFKYLFESCPEAKPLFGFSLDIDASCEELSKSKRFVAHATYLIQMFDASLNLLGPDIELLTEMMLELGKKHVRRGVKPVMFEEMGKALLHVLEDILKDGFNSKCREHWLEVYNALSEDMIKARIEFDSTH